MHIVCPYCNFSKDVPEERIPDSARSVRCPRCGNRFPFAKPKPEEEAPFSSPPEDPAEAGTGMEERETPPPALEETEFPEIGILEKKTEEEEYESAGEQPVVPPLAPPIPWEDPEERGVVGSLFRTIRRALFSPGALFFGASPEGSYGYPLSFALLLSSLGFAVQVAWLAFLEPRRVIQILELSGVPFDAGPLSVLLGLTVLVSVLIVAVVAGLYLKSILLHGCLMIFQGARVPFLGTFKVAAYASAALVFLWIPVVGNLLAVIWETVIVVIGLARIHGIGTGRSLLAVFFPWIVLAALAVVLALVLPLVQ